jgi:hypothetical protein
MHKSETSTAHRIVELSAHGGAVPPYLIVTAREREEGANRKHDMGPATAQGVAFAPTSATAFGDSSKCQENDVDRAQLNFVGRQA